MTDASAARDPSAPTAPRATSQAGRRDPAGRGRLDVAERVIERIATIAAGEVRGVRSVGSGLEGVVGRRYPNVKAEVAGGHARVRVDIAVTWPAPLGRTTAAVRDRVRERLQTLAGVTVDVVDVTVATITQPAPPNDRRVQ